MELSPLASLRVNHLQNTLDSDIKKSYMQDERCRLHKDHFGGRKVIIPSHPKAKICRFSYSDGLLWHQLSPYYPLRAYVTHKTYPKQKILYEFHDAPSSSHLGREKAFECQINFSGHTYTGG